MTDWGKIDSILFGEHNGFLMNYCWAVLSTWVLLDRLAQKKRCSTGGPLKEDEHTV